MDLRGENRWRNFEQYAIGSQLRRSSKSVSANIVGGFGRRRYKSEFLRFLVFAHSSCNETIAWMEYINDCYHNLDKRAEEILGKLDALGRKLNSFIRAVEKAHKS